MQFDFLQRLSRAAATPAPHALLVNGSSVPVRFVRNARARRYILRVTPDGVARVTMPRGGSAQEAANFARQHEAWIDGQLKKRQAIPSTGWFAGTEIFYRGDRMPLSVMPTAGPGLVMFGDQSLPVARAEDNLRASVERHLRRVANAELPPRTLELAAQHQLTVARVVVRDQRSRWGSCSARRTLSLNWRLVQTPLFVRDYIIVHELMHLREMNHSRRFWRHVADAFPQWREAELWLKRHGRSLR